MLNRDVLYRRNETSNVLMWVGITMVVGLLSLAVGLWLGNTVLDSSGDKVSELQAEVQGLQSDLWLADSQSQTLTEDLAATTQAEGSLRAQLSQVEKNVTSAIQTLAQQKSEFELLSSAQKQIEAYGQNNLDSLREMSDTVEKHRLLLVELRKELPQTREESLSYWISMKTIAAKADPALAPPADKVILKIDNYFDWSDRTPSVTASSDDFLDWRFVDYTSSGADAYLEATASFTKEAMLAVIAEMDTVVSQLN